MRNCPVDFDGVDGVGDGEVIEERQVDEIMEGAASAEMKESVIRETGEALESGAFGAPWMVVRNGAGEEVTFFGSDRFLYVYEHLGLRGGAWRYWGPRRGGPSCEAAVVRHTSFFTSIGKCGIVHTLY